MNDLKMTQNHKSNILHKIFKFQIRDYSHTLKPSIKSSGVEVSLFLFMVEKMGRKASNERRSSGSPLRHFRTSASVGFNPEKQNNASK